MFEKSGPGDRDAFGIRLGDDVDHADLAGFIQVAQGRGGWWHGNRDRELLMFEKSGPGWPGGPPLRL